jgi:hypothetical protein
MACRTHDLRLSHRLAVCFAGAALVCLTAARAGPPAATTNGTGGEARGATPVAKSTESFRDSAHSDRALKRYASLWGVDRMQVRQTSSGQLIRFSYRVVDATKAKVLDAKQATPYLIDATSRVMLQVPVMDKIGQLRQTSEPQNGQEYWMVFSNKGGHVKPGDRVAIVIGSFHVEGLAVL